MKIVTYNVNGLRQRVAQHGSLLRLLNSLDADIICFQETKLSRQDLSVDLITAEGYEAYISCTQTSSKGRSAYSGVATFCRVDSAFSSNEVALPLAAEEGFTGLLECSKRNEVIRSNFLIETPIKVEDLKDITKKDLLKMDSEGRCIITDHSHFVLFNLYGPRAEDDDEERLHFKYVFYKILEKRWELLLSQGRRVFVVGDLNIAPSAIDRCDAEPSFERNKFRKWLRSILKDCGGSFFDVFRSKHPRREAYTCFSPCVGAEEFNYGSRIDHILIAGPCLHQNQDFEGHNFLDCHVEECDIMTQFIRGKAGNAPKWKGGRSIKLEGSDHIPVYVIISGMSNLPLHNTPSLAVRYIPEVRGRQQSIVSFLRKGQMSSGTEHHMASAFPSETTETESCGRCFASSQDCGASSRNEMVTSLTQFPSDQKIQNLSISKPEAQSLDFSEHEKLGSIVNDAEIVTVALKNKKNKSCNRNMIMKKKARQSDCSQLTLKSFFKQPRIPNTTDIGTRNTDTSLTDLDTENGKDDLAHLEVSENASGKAEEISCEVNESSDSSINAHIQSQVATNLCCSYKKDKDNAATLEWQRIQQKMKLSLPLCKGHGEPCVARTVKKEGPNIGRGFYVCARAKGPASNPEANCGYFEWASLKSKHKYRMELTAGERGCTRPLPRLFRKYGLKVFHPFF